MPDEIRLNILAKIANLKTSMSRNELLIEEGKAKIAQAQNAVAAKGTYIDTLRAKKRNDEQIDRQNRNIRDYERELARQGDYLSALQAELHSDVPHTPSLSKVRWKGTLRQLAELWPLIEAKSELDALNQIALHFTDKNGKELSGKSLQQNLRNKREEVTP